MVEPSVERSTTEHVDFPAGSLGGGRKRETGRGGPTGPILTRHTCYLYSDTGRVGKGLIENSLVRGWLVTNFFEALKAQKDLLQPPSTHPIAIPCFYWNCRDPSFVHVHAGLNMLDLNMLELNLQHLNAPISRS